ncbi:hypothetical protein A3709_19355 [Halioglobus sp. HI00S01]|uniref:hypothetical protein n=1 Tax=Halioglobus sp. HI00S01 TaxID=1822214 RepID=UPI0007C21B6C|nr:hypothetical protein [Halioglobus sp. HI00S01]KZX57782.1 hypothetical protein A3709_19355 [Halioglobus sp. HI00S01]
MFYAKQSLTSTEDVDQAAKALVAAWDRSFSPAPSFDGRKKNKLRDMVCLLAGFDGGYQAFLAQIEEKLDPLPAYISDDRTVYINDTAIDDGTLEHNSIEYKLVERGELIRNLQDYIGDAPDYDRRLIMNDLVMLSTWTDEYVWSSLYTNDYLSPSLHTQQFNEVCNQLIALNVSPG